LMMGGRVVFGKMVGFVETALFPAHKQCALAHAVANPTKAHVNGLRMLLFDPVIGDTSGSAVVTLDWCGRLGMTEFFKTSAQGAGFFTIVEEGCKFSFSGAGEDSSMHDLAVWLDGTVGASGSGLVGSGGLERSRGQTRRKQPAARERALGAER
jgi:hypothetical protein